MIYILDNDREYSDYEIVFVDVGDPEPWTDELVLHGGHRYYNDVYHISAKVRDAEWIGIVPVPLVEWATCNLFLVASECASVPAQIVIDLAQQALDKFVAEGNTPNPNFMRTIQEQLATRDKAPSDG